MILTKNDVASRISKLAFATMSVRGSRLPTLGNQALCLGSPKGHHAIYPPKVVGRGRRQLGLFDSSNGGWLHLAGHVHRDSEVRWPPLYATGTGTGRTASDRIRILVSGRHGREPLDWSHG